MPALKTEVIDTIKDRKDLQRQLRSEMKWSYYQTNRYLNNNDSRLLNIRALNLIAQNLNKPVNELYE